jgi:exopolysaccharide biosynthesis polyprenyl glycosylphosphotransferase
MIRLLRVFVPLSVLILLLSEFLLVTLIFVAATYAALQVDPTVYLLYDRGFVRILLVVLTVLIGLHFQDLYSQIRVTSRILLWQQVCMVVGAALLAQGLISYVAPDLGTPLPIMLFGCPAAVIAIVAWRIVYSGYALPSMSRERILMAGDSPLLEELGAYLDGRPDLGLDVAGYVSLPREPETDREEAGTGRPSALTRAAESTHPNRIVIGLKQARAPVPIGELLELRFGGCEVEEAAAAYERILGRVSLKAVRPSQLVRSGELWPRPQIALYQALLNTLLAAVGIAIASPFMAAAAIAVRLSPSGGVLSRQTRVGLNGVPFTQYKFRTMTADAERVAGSAWVAASDPRLTRVGRILRRSRIDELPQLFSVLRGDMAMVGPHPERPEFVDALAARLPYYRQRHGVRPGLTGWAQLKYQTSAGPEDTVTKLEYDLYYLKNVSIAMDILIMFHTIKFIVLSHGAQ